MNKIWVQPSRCVACSYDLAGHDVGESCPECNKKIDYVQIDDPVAKALRSGWSLIDDPKRIAVILIVLAFFGCCVLAPIMDAIGPSVTGMDRDGWNDLIDPPPEP